MYSKKGKLVCKSKGGVDWYRYLTVRHVKIILIKKRLTFFCLGSCPAQVSSHSSRSARRFVLAQFSKKIMPLHTLMIGEVYNYHEVRRLLWPGNSPDLNMIKPAWDWLKRRTTARGAPAKREDAIRAWKQAWEDLGQEMIANGLGGSFVHLKSDSMRRRQWVPGRGNRWGDIKGNPSGDS